LDWCQGKTNCLCFGLFVSDPDRGWEGCVIGHLAKDNFGFTKVKAERERRHTFNFKLIFPT
jgi:hypothetical protein